MDTPREKILQFIIDNPSTHLRKIKNSLGYSMGTTQYHIAKLEHDGKIYSQKEQFYKNYFHISDDQDNTTLMSLLNLDSPRNILITLLNNEPCTHNEITKCVGLTSSTVSWHMRKLVEFGIVHLKYDGKYSIYSIKHRDELILLLRRYKDSTWNRMVNNVTDLFTSFQH